MTMSDDDAGTNGARRFEIFAGAGRRREWPPDVRVSIVAETSPGQESVGAVARRHGMIPSQLFTWRRERRKQMEAQGSVPPVAQVAASFFVRAIIEPSPPSEVLPVAKRPRRRRRSSLSAVELEIDGLAVKIASGADKELIAAVIEALKATR